LNVYFGKKERIKTKIDSDEVSPLGQSRILDSNTPPSMHLSLDIPAKWRGLSSILQYDIKSVEAL
jgi:hypothetical protein